MARPRRKLKLTITISLDGYAAGPNQSVRNPMGEGAERLHAWAVGTRSFQRMNGRAGGRGGLDDRYVAGLFRNVGASIMGRNMFGGGKGPWGKRPWRGWWGETPPYRHPVFVLTHHARPPLVMRGGTTFHFVSGGIRKALALARAAARGKDISLAGGASAAQQYLAAGLVDEMEIHVAPLLLGRGERLFDRIGGRQTGFQCVRVASSRLAAHFTYRRR